MKNIMLGVKVAGFFLYVLLSVTHASTHWIVTEDGRIQEQLESPFAIRQPDNVVAFMRQEKNYDEIKVMKDALLQEKEQIETNEDKDTDLESKHYRTDKDCKVAGKRLSDFDLFISSVLPLENKEIEITDFIDLTDLPTDLSSFEEPTCSDKYDLPFSVHAYDHLEGVRLCKILKYYAEAGLKSTLGFMDTLQETGHVINRALVKNHTSWVAYDLATFYWRLKGNGTQAVECARRGLHFSPEHYKDVALVNLANILHKSRYSLNASVVMKHALAISTHFNVNHFTLANIYAVLGDYNKSTQFYEKTLANQPNFEAAKMRLSAVRCQYNLQKKLLLQHESLQRTLLELRSYQKKHNIFLTKQDVLSKMQMDRQSQIDQHFSHIQQMFKEGNFNHKCKFQSKEGKSVLYCNLPSQEGEEEDVDLTRNVIIKSGIANEEFLAANTAPIARVQAMGRHVAKQPKKERYLIYNVSAQNTVGFRAFQPPTPQEDMSFYNWTDERWPPMSLCQSYLLRFPEWDEYPSDFINPESRGFLVKELLTDFIDVKEGSMPSEPWIPPDCETMEVIPAIEIDEIAGIKHRYDAPMHKTDLYLKYAIVRHINDGNAWPEDFAQRVHTALNKSLKSKNYRENLWILYNLAGLYWRMQGNNLHAVECLRRSYYHAPTEHKDVPLVQMAGIMYRLARVNDAVTMLVQALKINQSEPVSYMVMGNALQAYANFTGAIEFYMYALLLNPTYREAFHSLLIVKCADKVVRRNQKPRRTGCIGAKDNKSATVVTEFVQHGAILYTVARDNLPTITSNNVGADVMKEMEALVDKLETHSGNADSLLRDADSVIQKLADSLDGREGKLNDKVWRAQALMKRLSDMRSSLVMLVEEASSLHPHPVQIDDISHATCAETLAKVNLSRFVGTTVDLKMRGVEFHSELLEFDSYTDVDVTLEPACEVMDESFVRGLHSVVNREIFTNYSKEPAMKRILEWLIPIFHQGMLDDQKLHTLMINRLSKGLTKNPRSWKLALLASHYWRLQGKAKEALDCLCVAYANASVTMKDIALLGLANVFAFLHQWADAITVAKRAMETAPDLFVHYLTIANIYAAKGDIKRSIPFYRRALELQPESKSAKTWLKSALCHQMQDQ